MRYLLITFNDNWADEMDIVLYERVALNEDEYNDFMRVCEKARNLKNSAGKGFGSNEWNEYENGADFMSAHDIKEITEDQYNFLKEIGIGDDYLLGPIYEYVEECEKEEEE